MILDIDTGYGISIWEMTVSMLLSWISIWDILSLCLEVPHAERHLSRCRAILGGPQRLLRALTRRHPDPSSTYSLHASPLVTSSARCGGGGGGVALRCCVEEEGNPDLIQLWGFRLVFWLAAAARVARSGWRRGRQDASGPSQGGNAPGPRAGVRVSVVRSAERAPQSKPTLEGGKRLANQEGVREINEASCGVGRAALECGHSHVKRGWVVGCRGRACGPHLTMTVSTSCGGGACLQ